ncbi:MAG: type II secretion system protein GspG [Candidatus Methylomirabilales bacterium]
MLRKQVGPVTVAGMLLLVVVGCGESENPFQQYGKEVIQAHGRAERAQARANLRVLKTAIQQYQVETGRFPASLTDLPLVQNQGIDPNLYIYDPATGSVRLR